MHRHPHRLSIRLLLWLALAAAATAGCNDSQRPIVVNSLEDTASPATGTVTLRSALAAAASGQPIEFDAALDGGRIDLAIIGEPRTILPGEVMGMRIDPSGPISYLVGYFDRDYGASALFAKKDVVIDASSLPSGITVAWTGGTGNPARVLAVHGDLTLRRVVITGGVNVTEALPVVEPRAWRRPRGVGRGMALGV
jgi:hypothetical protein